MLKKKEIIILIIISMLAGSFIFLFHWTDPAENKILIITQNNQIIDRKSMQKNDVTVISTPEGKNTIVISDGKAYVKCADCPNQICVHSKAISDVGETIACLPHHLLLEIQYSEKRPNP